MRPICSDLWTEVNIYFWAFLFNIMYKNVYEILLHDPLANIFSLFRVTSIYDKSSLKVKSNKNVLENDCICWFISLLIYDLSRK